MIRNRVHEAATKPSFQALYDALPPSDATCPLPTQTSALYGVPGAFGQVVLSVPTMLREQRLESVDCEPRSATVDHAVTIGTDQRQIT